MKKRGTAATPGVPPRRDVSGQSGDYFVLGVLSVATRSIANSDFEALLLDSAFTDVAIIFPSFSV